MLTFDPVGGQCDARPTVTYLAWEHHRPSTSHRLRCLVTVTLEFERLAGGDHSRLSSGEIRTRDLSITSPTLYHKATEPHRLLVVSDSFQRLRSSEIGAIIILLFIIIVFVTVIVIVIIIIIIIIIITCVFSVTMQYLTRQII